MKRLALVLTLVVVSGAANATEVRRYDQGAIDASIKCELSRVDSILRDQHSNFTAIKARIKVSKTDTKNIKVAASAGFFSFNAAVSYESKVVARNSVEFNRNILEANAPNCDKSFAVDVGVFDCFQQNLSGFAGINFTSDNSSKIDCSLDTSATAELSASGKFKAWIIDAGPSGDVSVTRAWHIEVLAPPN
jgi:hypothetical protein